MSTHPGPAIRTDIVDVYLVRRGESGEPSSLLLLRRAAGPMAGTWHPVMGHITPGERAVEAALREVREETGLGRDAPELRALWALEQVHPYFVPELDAIVLSPRFVVEVADTWEPALDDAHDAARWIDAADAGAALLWPGQRAAWLEITSGLRRGSALGDALRIDLASSDSGPTDSRR